MSSRVLAAQVILVLVFSGCGPSNPFRSPPQSPPPPSEVPVPYGTQDPEDATGASSTVNMAENEHFQDVLQMLRSSVPGLQVTELPNGEIQLRIRGANQTLRTENEYNQPLLVIDGMSILPSRIRQALQGIHPRQVESISVLRDVSSTAIYGTRGANGVILIQLKR